VTTRLNSSKDALLHKPPSRFTFCTKNIFLQISATRPVTFTLQSGMDSEVPIVTFEKPRLENLLSQRQTPVPKTRGLLGADEN
jgi:hypothetical protein